MKYAFDGDGVKHCLMPAIEAFMKKRPREQRAFVGEILIYLRDSLPIKGNEHIMDYISTKEAYGYETIRDAEIAEAEAVGGLAEKRRMAKAFLHEGVPLGTVVSVTGLSEAEILAL